MIEAPAPVAPSGCMADVGAEDELLGTSFGMLLGYLTVCF